MRKSFQTEINGKQTYDVDADMKINGCAPSSDSYKGDTKIVVTQASIKSDYDTTLKEVKKLEKTLRIKE